jgi:hypothetical protein
MDIEKALLPNVGKLIIKRGVLTAQIMDAELDIVDLSFDGGEVITIKPGKLKYIDLTARNLGQMMMLLEQANKYHDKQYKAFVKREQKKANQKINKSKNQ